MIPWIRNIVFILLILTAIYVALRFTSRYMRREKLKAEYKSVDLATPKDEYIATGLKKYDRSLKPKLFIFVYLIPLLIMGGLIYLAQYS